MVRGGLEQLVSLRRDVFTLADASHAGVRARDIQVLVRDGVLSRVGRGVYAVAAELAKLDPWERHALSVRGFILGCQYKVYASGLSAIALRRVRRIGAPPRLPTAVRPSESNASGTARSHNGLIRSVPLDERYRGQAWGCPSVTPSWALVDLARTAPQPQALVIADALLAAGSSKHAMRRVAATMDRWPGVTSAMWIIDNADGRSESTLETLGRLACLEFGLPVPLTNVWVGRDGPVYRVDHLWPWHGVVGEGDGATKYRDAADPAAVVGDEKERQWYLERELGLDVVRYGWDLAFHDRRSLAARFETVLRWNPRREEPVRFWDRRY